ncbi:MAG: RDD family protein [Syntrophomonas sp.]
MEDFEANNSIDQESKQNEPSLQSEQFNEPIAISPQIAGFWKRILALVLDSILIGVIGMGLGALFYDQLAAMGNWARLIGLEYRGSKESM